MRPQALGRRRRALAGLVALALVAGACSDDGDGGRGTGGAPGTSTSSTTTGGSVADVGAPGVGDPYFPTVGNGGYDVGHYDLALRWLPDAGRLEGVATITATATQRLRRFDLDLAGLEVASVSVDGRAATVARRGRELVVTPAAPLASRARFTTVVRYAGSPRPVSEGTDLFDEGWQTHGREAFVVAEPNGAETWFPANDHPTDKATYALHVTAPADQTVAANGLLTSSTPGTGSGAGTTTWTYEARDPIAPYLVQVAIGDYELVDGGTVDGVTIRHALHRSYADEARTTVARTGELLRFLEGVWGPYPFEAYGVLAVPVPLGFALETQTLTLVGSDIGSGGRDSDVTLLHELAHQWVGDSVSLESWQDLWLNEGFATYSEWLWVEHEGGPTAAQSARHLGPGLDRPAGDPGRDDLFGPTVYERGALTLQAVREAVGDEVFTRILRAWTAEHRHANASRADFEALAERESGQHLDALLHRFLDEPGTPTLGPPPAASRV